MKNKLTLFILIIISMTFYVQSQSLKQKIFKDKKIKNYRLIKPKSANTPFFSKGNLFVTSDKTQVVSYFTLKENNQQGNVINGATILVNNKKINPTKIPGEYAGESPIAINKSGSYFVEIKIVTPNKRVLTAKGTIDALLKLEVSNIFPKQPNKIDVGNPVKINWFFSPKKFKPVTLSIFDTNNKREIYKKTITKQKVIIPTDIIPKKKTIIIKVSIPVIHLQYDQPTSKESVLILHIRDEKTLHTFG